MEMTINQLIETLINNKVTPDEYKKYFEGVKANEYVINVCNFIGWMHDAN